MDIPPKSILHAAKERKPAPDDKAAREQKRGPSLLRTVSPSGKPASSQTPAARPSDTLKQRGAVSPSPPEQLPVLSAFQDFLDKERRQSRHRMIGLSVFFVVMLLTVAGASFLVGATFFHQMKQDFSDIRSDMGTFKGDYVTVKESLLNRLSEVVKRSDDLETRLTRQEKQVSGLPDVGDKVSSLREVVDSLTEENIQLRTELNSIRGYMPALSNRVDAVLLELAKLQPKAKTTGMAGTAGGHTGLVLSIMPPGKLRPVQWRLPIPE